jgi:hypothetical protein
VPAAYSVNELSIASFTVYQANMHQHKCRPLSAVQQRLLCRLKVHLAAREIPYVMLLSLQFNQVLRPNEC